jgi:hypothetical protein
MDHCSEENIQDPSTFLLQVMKSLNQFVSQKTLQNSKIVPLLVLINLILYANGGKLSNTKGFL